MEPQTYKNWIRGIFDRAASAYGQANTDYFNIFAANLVQLAALRQDSTVLDIATGRGAVIKEVLKTIGQQGKAVGIDISSAMIEETRRELANKNYTNAQFLCMDAEHLTFENEAFTDLFCGFGIFFLPHIDVALKGFLRVLKPKGCLWFTTWAERGICTGYLVESLVNALGSEEMKTPLTLHRLDDKDTISHVLSQAGFGDIQIVTKTLDFVYPTLDDWFASLWSHASRGRFEMLDADQIIQIKQSLRRKIEPLLQADGLHEQLCVHFTKARKL